MCRQFPEQCHGFFGPGSDKKTNTSANCRLEIAEGSRGARWYWRRGRAFFRTTCSSSSVLVTHAHSGGPASN